MTLHHIVLGGGGIEAIIFQLGALEECFRSGALNSQSIQSISGTSAGSIVAVMLALNYSWSDIKCYMIERPWENCFAKPLVDRVRNMSPIDSRDFIEQVLGKLLEAKSLSLDITIEDFFQSTKVRINIIVTEVAKGDSLRKVVLNHETRPSMFLFDAVAASCSVPYVFYPIVCGDEVFVDGGFMDNFPLACVEDNLTTTLGIGSVRARQLDPMKPEDLIVLFLRRVSVAKGKLRPQVLITPMVPWSLGNVSSWLPLLTSREERERCWQEGGSGALASINRSSVLGELSSGTL